MRFDGAEPREVEVVHKATKWLVYRMSGQQLLIKVPCDLTVNKLIIIDNRKGGEELYWFPSSVSHDQYLSSLLSHLYPMAL